MSDPTTTPIPSGPLRDLMCSLPYGRRRQPPFAEQPIVSDRAVPYVVARAISYGIGRILRVRWTWLPVGPAGLARHHRATRIGAAVAKRDELRGPWAVAGREVVAMTLHVR